MTRLRAGLAIGLAAVIANPAGAAETLRPLLQQSLPNASGKSFTAVEVAFAPGAKAAPHRHGDAFVYAYVLSGAVRSQLAGEPVRIYRAGQGWSEPPGADHRLTQNASRTAPARLLVIFVSTTGDPLKIPEPAEENSPMPLAPAPPAAVTQPAPQQMVDALYTAFGDHHSRAVHAKGVMATGTFEPSADAAGLVASPLFSSGRLAVLARFSDFTGIPEIPDTAGEANPRGLALKFSLSEGSSADVVAHSFNGFPAATAADFRELLLAIGASGPNAAKPTPLDLFLASHPVARTFLTTQKPAPQSYATLSYFGVNAFAFTDAHGRTTFVRYRFTPQDGESFVPANELSGRGPDYLQTELPARLAKGPVSFTWWAQVAAPGDPIDDPSIAWPEDRRQVKLGVIRLDRLPADPAATDKRTQFAPLNVPSGIAGADPMLGLRQQAYPLSFRHRQ